MEWVVIETNFCALPESTQGPFTPESENYNQFLTTVLVYHDAYFMEVISWACFSSTLAYCSGWHGQAVRDLVVTCIFSEKSWLSDVKIWDSLSLNMHVKLSWTYLWTQWYFHLKFLYWICLEFCFVFMLSFMIRISLNCVLVCSRCDFDWQVKLVLCM